MVVKNKALPTRLFVKVMCLLVIGCGGGTSGTDTGGMTTVRGRLFEQDGTAINGASVTVEESGDASTTNQLGQFEIPTQLPSQTLSFSVQAGDVLATSETTQLPANPEIVDVELQADLSAQTVEVVSTNIIPRDDEDPATPDNDTNFLNVTVRIHGLGAMAQKSSVRDFGGYGSQSQSSFLLNGDHAIANLQSAFGNYSYILEFSTPFGNGSIDLRNVAINLTSFTLDANAYIRPVPDGSGYYFALGNFKFSSSPPMQGKPELTSLPHIEQNANLNFSLPSAGLQLIVKLRPQPSSLKLSAKLLSPPPNTFLTNGNQSNTFIIQFNPDLPPPSNLDLLVKSGDARGNISINNLEGSQGIITRSVKIIKEKKNLVEKPM